MSKNSAVKECVRIPVVQEEVDKSRERGGQNSLRPFLTFLEQDTQSETEGRRERK